MSCPPAMRYHEVNRSGKVHKYLLRGDSDGAVVVWSIPEVTNSQLAQIKQEEFDKPPGLLAFILSKYLIKILLYLIILLYIANFGNLVKF